MPRRSKSDTAITPQRAFAVALKRVRKDRGMSQEQVAFEGSFHPTYISQLERGVKEPSLTTLLGLAKAMDVSASIIVDEVERLLPKSWRREEQQGHKAR